jgi:multidrug efflux pump subunit AcrA (membrane-fusion protein)
VPRDAIVAKADGTREVWRVREEDGIQKAYPVRVQVGRAGGDRLEVEAEELRVGDPVVMLGNERLQPGQSVQPQQDSAEPDTAAVN